MASGGTRAAVAVVPVPALLSLPSAAQSDSAPVVLGSASGKTRALRRGQQQAPRMQQGPVASTGPLADKTGAAHASPPPVPLPRSRDSGTLVPVGAAAASCAPASPSAPANASVPPTPAELDTLFAGAFGDAYEAGGACEWHGAGGGGGGAPSPGSEASGGGSGSDDS